jgi:hypothetical protein
MPNQRVEAISLRGSVPTRDQAAPLLTQTGDGVIVERGVLRSLVMRCPCGCGDDLFINLDPRAGPAWRLFNRRRGLTLYPSYWRESECGAHFILWNNRIIWCGRWDETDEDEWWYRTGLDVRPALSSEEFRNYEAVADQMNELPWDVLTACRQLVRKKEAVEMSGKRQRGWFKLTAR